MITAKEFLATAALHDDEEALFLAALRAIASEAESAKREYAGFIVKMPINALTPNIAAALRIHLRKEGWEAQCQPVQGAIGPQWAILMSPAEEEITAAAIRFKGHEN